MESPAIAISPALMQHLQRRGMPYLVVEVAECKSWGGALAEVFARIPRKAEPARLAKSGCRTIEAEGITVFLTHRLIRVDERVELGLRNFMGVKDVTVKGLHL